VLINASVGASWTALSLLFAIKERLSSSFERDARLVDGPSRPLPLYLQGFEEAWLALLFATAQMSVFWIGYEPDARRRQLALALSWAALFVSASVSFIAPLLQRHGLRYATIGKLLVKRPITLFGFGALFTLPAVLLGRHALAHSWSLGQALRAVAACTVVSVALATLAGTWLASRLLPAAHTTRPPGLLARAAVNLALLALTAFNVHRFGAVALSLHHKSQLLKCKYQLTSIGIDLPSLSAALKKSVDVNLKLDLRIENPTPFDVEIEDNRLELSHDGVNVATARISPLAVPAHETRMPHVEIPLHVEVATLTHARELTDWSRWKGTLFVWVAKDFELPIYLFGYMPTNPNQ
jgi:hypothetical protein